MRYNSKKYSCLAVIVALVAVFSATKAHAAREHLYGHVVDADSVPVPETLVSLLELPDTTYVATVITDSQGRFDFDRSDERGGGKKGSAKLRNRGWAEE